MKEQTRAYLAFVFISIIWGTTYLAIRVAVIHYPPYLMAGTRQLIAGIIMLVIALLVNRKADLSKANLLRQATVGFLLITMGNGLVTWGEQYVESGVAALICATMPISAVIINIITGKERLNLLIFIGMLFGFAGVALIFYDKLGTTNNSQLFLLGIIGTFVATFCWALGSTMNKSSKPSTNTFFNVGFQVLIGGALMLLISPFVDDYSHIVWFQPEGLSAVVYLIIFGSILAYAAYMYALKILPVGFVTSYAYINPFVAVILGYFMLHEPLNHYTILSFLLIISGIFVVRLGYKKQSTAATLSKQF